MFDELNCFKPLGTLLRCFLQTHIFFLKLVCHLMFAISVPVWSSVNVAGVMLDDIEHGSPSKPEDKEWQDQIHRSVVQR